MKLLQLLIVFWVALTLFWQTASAQYADWKESGSIYLNTTAEGADLPAEASVEHFPLLLRLHRDFFNFETAAPKGGDVRFSMKGEALAYQIEHWDATRGKASIWVRIPKIQGNSQQEITIHWDKKDAKSESDGKKVFNESNGYLSVLHMGDKPSALAQWRRLSSFVTARRSGRERSTWSAGERAWVRRTNWKNVYCTHSSDNVCFVGSYGWATSRTDKTCKKVVL